MSVLDATVAELAARLGADLYGVADLARVHGALELWGGDMVAYPRSISVGVRLPNAIVDELPRNNHAAARNYALHAYAAINQRLDAIVSQLGSLLQREGQRAFPIASADVTFADRLYGTFSHKMGARLAGLGWIGKSCLLVTPEFGPRVRWATVLTDAPLTPTGSPLADGCGDCQQCVDICPPHAFTGRPFAEDEPRELRYDAHACERHLEARKGEVGDGVCGLCLYVCPYGRGRAR